MTQLNRALGALVCIALTSGCGGPTRTYEVNVKNQTDEPVTIWLTKSGPPMENKWKAPEHWAIERPTEENPIGGVIVPMRNEASTGKISGQFPRGTDAVLRVYLGQRTLSELLAISSGSPNRIDVYLQPGLNNLIVRQRDGQTIVDREAAQAGNGASR